MKKTTTTDYSTEPAIINKKERMRTRLMTEPQLLEYVLYENGRRIFNIENPSKAVQLESLRLSPTNIKYIDDPCLEAQLIAVNSCGYWVLDIKNPPDEVIEAAIARNKGVMDYLKPNIKLWHNNNFFDDIAE
ncbi:MAG: hypothetical protein FWG90_00440 [Oscillospiraceae bacterium]|nr:hypothetical protein [Oscillospiraceae bacterium]